MTRGDDEPTLFGRTAGKEGMAAKHVGLGRGLGALIKDTPASEDAAAPSGGTTLLPIGQVHKSPWQPRRTFEPEALEDDDDLARFCGHAIAFVSELPPK